MPTTKKKTLAVTPITKKKKKKTAAPISSSAITTKRLLQARTSQKRKWTRNLRKILEKQGRAKYTTQWREYLLGKYCPEEKCHALLPTTAMLQTNLTHCTATVLLESMGALSHITPFQLHRGIIHLPTQTEQQTPLLPQPSTENMTSIVLPYVEMTQAHGIGCTFCSYTDNNSEELLTGYLWHGHAPRAFIPCCKKHAEAALKM
jgi:hypothetical protein